MTKDEQKFDAAMYRRNHSEGIARAYAHAAEVMGSSEFPELKQAAKEVARMAQTPEDAFQRFCDARETNTTVQRKRGYGND